MRSDQIFKGILLAFAAFAAYSCSDAAVKYIAGRISPFESAFFGACFGLVALPFLKKKADRWSDIFATTNRPLWIVRFVAKGLGCIGSVTAFTHLSMAEAFCLIFLLPSFVTIMSVIFLKETVGLKRWGAVALGFVGVLIVLRPGFRELSIGHAGAVLAGISGAVSIVVFRAVGPAEKNLSQYGSGLLGILVICGLAMIPSYAPPAPQDWLLLAAYGLLGAVGNVLIMYAAFYTPAAILAPTQYSQMIWAILFGYLIFGDAVDAPMLAGIGLIVGSGLLTLSRERTKGVALPPPMTPDGQADAMVKPER